MMAGIALGDGEVVAVGSDGSFATSPDGQRWITWQVTPWVRFGGVAWTRSRYVLVGWYGNVYTSP